MDKPLLNLYFWFKVRKIRGPLDNFLAVTKLTFNWSNCENFKSRSDLKNNKKNIVWQSDYQT